MDGARGAAGAHGQQRGNGAGHALRQVPQAPAIIVHPVHPCDIRCGRGDRSGGALRPQRPSGPRAGFGLARDWGRGMERDMNGWRLGGSGGSVVRFDAEGAVGVFFARRPHAP